MAGFHLAGTGFLVLATLALVSCQLNENLVNQYAGLAGMENDVDSDDSVDKLVAELYLKGLDDGGYQDMLDINPNDFQFRNFADDQLPDILDHQEDKRFSEFLGGKKKRFNEFLGGKKKRFNEFLGGKKRFSEFLGGKKKRFNEFLGGKKKRFSEFLGGKRAASSSSLPVIGNYPVKRDLEFLGGR